MVRAGAADVWAGAAARCVVRVATGDAGEALGELDAVSGAAATVEAMIVSALDESPAETVVPLVAAQPAASTRRAANTPTYAPKPRLAVCFPAGGGFVGPESGSGNEDMITVSHIKATQCCGVGDSSNSQECLRAHHLRGAVKPLEAGRAGGGAKQETYILSPC